MKEITEELYVHNESDMMLRYFFDRNSPKRTIQLGFYCTKYGMSWTGLETNFIGASYIFYINSQVKTAMFPSDFTKIGDI